MTVCSRLKVFFVFFFVKLNLDYDITQAVPIISSLCQI